MQMLFVNSAARCVQYWFRLLKQPLNRYSRKAYEMLYGMQERDCASRNWVAQIKCLLCYNGFGYVCVYGCVGNEKMFITKFKNRLRDSCCQKWFSHLAKSERFDLYSSFKNNYLWVWKIPGSYTKQGVQNCTSSLSYGRFACKRPQTSLLSSRKQTTLPFLCRYDWRRMSRAFCMLSVQSVKRQVPLAFIQRLTWERTLMQTMQWFGQ